MNTKSNIDKRKAEIKELAAKIDEAVKNYTLDPDALYELFLFKQQFREYSMNNVILIYKQREGALQVAPFSKWKEQGYNVRKGEHALKIFAPCLTSFVYDKDKNVICRLKDATPEQKKLITSGEYTVERKKTGYTLVPVFDISQTDCPIEKYPKAFSQDFILGNDVHATTLFSIIKDFLCDELGHSVSFASDQERAQVLNGARGVTIFPREDKSSEPVKILIDATLPENQQLKTLAHETAHALLHNPHTNVDKNTELPLALPRALAEYQAELCAGIVSQYYGIDSMRANASYIAGWVNDVEVPEAEKNKLLKQVLSTAEQVITYTDYVLEHTYHLTHENFSKSEKKDEMTTPAAIKEDDIGYYNHNDYWKVEFNETDSSIPLLSYSGRIVNDDLIDHLKVLNFELSSAGSIDSGYYKFYFDHYVNGKCVDHIRLDFGEIDPADTNSELDLLKPSTREALDTSLRTNTDSLSESHTQQAGDIFTSTLDAAEKQAAAENTHRPPHTPPEQER